MNPVVFEKGDVVKVRGWQGQFRVMGYAKDGSVTVWGGTTGHEMTRNAPPEHVRRSSGKPPASTTPPTQRRRGGR